MSKPDLLLVPIIEIVNQTLPKMETKCSHEGSKAQRKHGELKND
jgi:hypothetical protein